nr:immunoglobulin heavy chain junction region [Macaca mulatta]MOV54077.1 immunoglobulin heavy chain junction region [Macaca mulatta]MOV54641.1 immunoglobulin heavy chain junction region [Macaca mulatta]MOV58902.1 immunoglobulin heavy chain junction region [Macaca mulatta]
CARREGRISLGVDRFDVW